VLLVMAAVVAGVVLLLVFLIRRSTPVVPSTGGQGASDVAVRLAGLDELRARELLSPQEYAAKRAAILGEL
jgi:hypothetical protein